MYYYIFEFQTQSKLQASWIAFGLPHSENNALETTRSYCAPSASLVLITGPCSRICNYYRRPLFRSLLAALPIAASIALRKTTPLSSSPGKRYVMRWDTKRRSASKKQYC